MKKIMGSNARIDEEKLNVYSHALGIAFAILGSLILIYFTLNSAKLPGVLIYCFSLILLFSASTLYHAALTPNRKENLRKLDHISIYYLIAGTYTPVCLLVLHSSKGIPLLYIVWGLALLGTLLKLKFTGKFETLSLLLYAVMGWIIVIDIKEFLALATIEEVVLLSLGGFFYTFGIVFYALKRIPYNHFIWHLFVLGGATSHWVMIYLIINR